MMAQTTARTEVQAEPLQEPLPGHGPLGTHATGEEHHHHTHTARSRHTGGHHLLSVEHLSVEFEMYDPDAPYFRAGRVRSPGLRDLTLSVHEGELLAVVGQSGSGKSVLASTLMGDFEPNAHVRGRVWFDGRELDGEGLRVLAGHGISLVPQSVANLDPLMRVGDQIAGPLPRDRAAREARLARMRALMAAHELAPEVEHMYPYQLSGGMARRVLLLCALMDDARLLVADEPTPGLDLDLAVRAVGDLRAFADGGGGVVLITHDLELALRVADRVAVFHEGTVVEETGVESFADPSRLRHPFTRALWHALPGHDFAAAAPVPDGAEDGVPGATGGAEGARTGEVAR